jgi:hypothetical protein
MPLGMGGWNRLLPPTGLAMRASSERFHGSRLGILGLSWSCVVSWDRPFDHPVPLPSGAPARTLRDAANYIKKLPKAEHDSQEWRLAVQMLIDAAEDRGPMLFAKMGLLRATNRHVERVFKPDRKEMDTR